MCFERDYKYMSSDISSSVVLLRLLCDSGLLYRVCDKLSCGEIDDRDSKLIMRVYSILDKTEKELFIDLFNSWSDDVTWSKYLRLYYSINPEQLESGDAIN